MSTIDLSEHFTYRKLIWFVLPCILIFLVDTTYGMIDGFFVSNFAGKNALASLNLIMPLPTAIGTLGFMFGTGGSALIAAVLGKNKKEFAKKIFTMVVSAILVVGVILSFIAYIYMEEIALFLGADENLIDGCVIYGKILICSIPFFILQNAFNSLLITAGKRSYGLIFIIITAISNITLDVVLIYKWDMGLIGAAIATGFSYFIGGLMPLLYFLSGKNKVLSFAKTRMNSKIIEKVCSNGSSEMISNISVAIVSIIYNLQLIKLMGVNSTDGVAAYGVIMYLNFVFLAIFLGFASGSISIIGYKYGAEDKNELKSIFRKSMVFILFVGCLMACLSNIYADKLAYIFINYDEDLHRLTTYAIKIYSISYALCGFNIFGSAYFTGLNDGKTSALISFLRTFVLQIASIFILPRIFGIESIWASIIVAEGITLLITIFLFIRSNNKEFEEDKVAMMEDAYESRKKKKLKKSKFNVVNGDKIVPRSVVNASKKNDSDEEEEENNKEESNDDLPENNKDDSKNEEENDKEEDNESSENDDEGKKVKIGF